jgi:predicted nucleic-acid-binding Zn-ribbon protein
LQASFKPVEAPAIEPPVANPATFREGVPPAPAASATQPTCPKCHATEMIVDAWAWSQYGHGIVVFENPEALVFKGARYGWLRANVCGACGFTEFFVSNPAELLKAYRKSKIESAP